MSHNSRSSNSKQRNRSRYNLRKSTTEQRLEIQERLTGLRKTRTEIDNQCTFLEQLLEELHITETFDNESNQQQNNHHSNSGIDRTSSVSDASSLSFEEVSFRTAPTSRQAELHQAHKAPSSHRHPDSSFSRIRGISATPTDSVPPGFDRLAPYDTGDAVEITNPRDPEVGKQGVVHKKTLCFIYFSHDRASYQRAPQNLTRIHISEYNPW